MKRARVYVVEEYHNGRWYGFDACHTAADAREVCRDWGIYGGSTCRVMAYDRADRKPMLVCKGSKSDD